MQCQRLNNVPDLTQFWQVDNLFIAGQPSEESFEMLAKMGFTKIFNMRSENESDFNFEIEACQRLGMEYIQFPIVENGELIPDHCKKLTECIDAEINAENKCLIHCGSGNRIAAWLMTYLPLSRGISFEEAVQIAMNNGLSSPAFIEQAKKIVESY